MTLKNRALARFFVLGMAIGGMVAGANAQSPGKPAPRFEIQSYAVEGNTLLRQARIERVLAEFTGKDREFADVQKARAALQDAYASRGFTAVRVTVPQQDLVGGKVRLVVTEAKVRRVIVEGNKHYNEANVRAALPALREGVAPNTALIGREVQLANENPVKRSSVRLQPGGADGSVDAVVSVVDDKPSRFSVYLDNSGNSQTGYYRAGVGYMNANLFNRDHVLMFQAVTSPTKMDDVLILGAAYRMPLYGRNASLEFLAVHSDVNSGTVPGLLNVSGSGTVLGARFNLVLPRIAEYEHKASIGYDYRAYRQNVTFAGFADPLFPDITVKPVTLGYSGHYSRVGRDITAGASFSQNLPGGGDSSQDAFSLPQGTRIANRPQARAAYNLWRFNAAWSEALPRDFLLRAAFNAQYTNDRLVAVEQFGMGGADSVRGFNEREAASDIGHRLSLEAYSPDFGRSLGANWRARGLVFIDVARGRDNDPVRDPTTVKNGLGSYGLGLRLSEGKALNVRVDWAHVTNAAGTRVVGKDKVFFSVAYNF